MSTSIDLDACRVIRRALIIGLSSYGEIERVGNAYSIHTDVVGESVPDELRPLHPTGSDDTVGVFADALAFVDSMEWEICEGEPKVSGVAS